MYVFAENKKEVIDAFSKNKKIKDKIYILNSCENWKMGEEGIVLLDIEEYLYNFEEYGGKKYIPIVKNDINIKINTHEHLQKKCRCYVDFLPEEIAVKFLKMIAQKTKSLVGIGMEHERGDMPYDNYCWIFDYRKRDTAEFTKEYIEVDENINFYPASKKDLVKPREYIHACYEASEGYDNFYLTGCPAGVRKRWKTSSGNIDSLKYLNEAFGIKEFPYLVDLHKYDLSAFSFSSQKTNC